MKRAATLTKTIKLDIACGQHKAEGFTGIDIAPIKGVDIVHDLNQFPWPLADNSVEEVHCSHYAEHVPDLIAFVNEIWRICKKDAQVRLYHPYYTSIRATQDPTHVRFLSEATWYYFDQNWLKEQGLDHYPIKCDFEVVSVVGSFNPPWDKRNEEMQRFALLHYVNVVSDLAVVLKVRKN